jgi:2-amino-4-hydroxy-6-hydroxymethyldihydropteridine diphosphokinase
LAHLRGAVEEIASTSDFHSASGLYETPPVGGPEQDPYLNAVVVFASSLGPLDLLQSLQAIESGHDRERSVHWGPRTVDLDIVAMEPGHVNTDLLTIPHPRAAERRFVLEPLCDVWPQAPVGAGVTASQAKERVGGQEVDLLATTWVHPQPGPGRYWVGTQFVFFVAVAVSLIVNGSLPSSGLSWNTIVGVLLIALGAWAALSSSRELGKAFTAMPEPVAGAELVESGLFSQVRHPIYGAVLLIVFGASILLMSPVAALVSFGLGLFFWAKSNYEERQLRIVYPGYSSYRRRVSKRFLPFLV